MYIGRYGYNSNYTSYAATAGYKKKNSGVAGEIMYEYCGQTGANRVIQCKEGRGKTDAAARAAARAHFCASYGKDGKCYGDPGGPAHTPTPKPTSTPTLTSRSDSLKKIQTAIASGGKGGRGSGVGGGAGDCTHRPCPPPSAKGDIAGTWNQMSCQFGNMTCHALPDWGLSVIVGLGGILIIGLLTKGKRR